jgi:hypothetical protein
MSVKNSIQTVPMTTYASSTVTGTYAPMITGGLAKACFLLRITNASTKDIQISFDGITDADYIFSATANNIPSIYPLIPTTNYANFSAGTQIYVKGTAGTGDIYIAGYYQPQGV